MLWNNLLGATAMKPSLKFVGGAADSVSSSTQTPSLSLSSLSGGLDTSPSSGDIVIASVSVYSSIDLSITTNTSGYTEIGDYAINEPSLGVFLNLGIYYKVLSSSESSVQFNLGLSNSNISMVAHVWRNVNPTTPLDATTTSANGTGVPDAPSITTVTENSVVIAVGSGSYDNHSVPSGMENYFTAFSGFFGPRLSFASTFRPNTGSYNPPVFGGSSSSLKWLSSTIALRPVQ